MITNFTFNELIKTNTGLDNVPNDLNIIKNLVRLAEFLQTIRNELHLPIIVDSGYRSAQVNESVGGVSSSYHVKGLAADIRCSDMDRLLAVLREHLFECDQIRNILQQCYTTLVSCRISRTRRIAKESDIH